MIEARKRLHDFVAWLIEDHEKLYREKNPKIYKTSKLLLDCLYPLRETMTLDQLLHELMMNLHGGFETTGKSIPATLLLLAMNPTEQDKLVTEIESILSSEFDDIDEQKLSQMVYLDMVIKESLRFFPQAIIHLRECSKDVKLSKN